MRMRGRVVRGGALVALVAVLVGCVPLSPLHSATAYGMATGLKAQALTTMSKATNPFDEHAEEVAALVLEIDKAIEYARGRPRNEIAVLQWELLMGPDAALLGAFLNRWEREDTLGDAFVQESRAQVASAFDSIIRLESGLVRGSGS